LSTSRPLAPAGMPHQRCAAQGSGAKEESLWAEAEERMAESGRPVSLS